MSVSIAAIICAAGSSSRMGGVKKEFRKLPSASDDDRQLTVLTAAVHSFASCSQIDTIVIAVPHGQESICKSWLGAELTAGSRINVISGGATRRESVHNALLFLEASRSEAASRSPTHVLIHDGARPWIKSHLIQKIIDAVLVHGAAIPVLPLIETPKEISGGFIKRHLRRSELVCAQTPQGFKFPEILSAHEKAKAREERENFEYTDDAEVWGEFIGQVAVIPGDPENKKITYPEDLEPSRALIW